MLLKVISLPHK